MPTRSASRSPSRRSDSCLKGAPYLKSFSYDDVIALAQSAKGDDKFGYRAEFINLVRLAKSARQ